MSRSHKNGNRPWRIFSSLLVCAFNLCFYARAQQRNLVPPSQGVAPAIVTAHSGIRSSGSGENWSQWYRLEVGRAPTGYTVQKAEFWLSGDRACGPTAECWEILRNDQQVLWEFRLKRHDGSGAGKAAFSEGHIRVTYRPR